MRLTCWLCLCAGLCVSCGETSRPVADATTTTTLAALTVDTGSPSPDGGALDLAPDTQEAPPPPCSGCTDLLTCCQAKDRTCYGDPQRGVICECPTLWECSGTSCWQPVQPPDPGSGWLCEWSASGYTCTNKRAPTATRFGFGCNKVNDDYKCVLAIAPTPCNRADGVRSWTCAVDQAKSTLRCEPVSQ